jgi:hypothetical protein
MTNGFVSISSGQVLLSRNKIKKDGKAKESNLAPHKSEKNHLPPQKLSEHGDYWFCVY